MSSERTTLSEPVEVAEFWANRRGESVRIQLREFEGVLVVDVRKFYSAADGVMRPTAKGITLSIRKLPELAVGICKALKVARERGLLRDTQ